MTQFTDTTSGPLEGAVHAGESSALARINTASRWAPGNGEPFAATAERLVTRDDLICYGLVQPTSPNILTGTEETDPMGPGKRHPAERS
jgi:hypothetical protein